MAQIDIDLVGFSRAYVLGYYADALFNVLEKYESFEEELNEIRFTMKKYCKFLVSDYNTNQERLGTLAIDMTARNEEKCFEGI